MIEIELVRKSLLCVVLGADIFLLVWAIRTRAFARVMNPAREVVVIGLLTDASEIGGECAAFQLVMFHGMAGHTTARLKEFLATSCITGFLFG